ncbi:hypothetical protein FISHEDRAFT_48268 [Fistulina hepatica ATCC 64428]|uniref:NTF2-like protein n=1 Tax=Fistulina hepatica ATCC 64428 TaxID=1128425 RepID=A0A0D7A552_9AGAR|nr:hypothetical protein FISHEDRAFT_48268 [Fistulina hepatica ATCC 64428]
MASTVSRPSSYDPNSPNEALVTLPNAPLVTLSANAVLQPPLTRRGVGPGMIVFLPPIGRQRFELSTRSESEKPLDPEPVQKWAEEGFAVVGVTASTEIGAWSIDDAFTRGVDALLELKELDIKDKVAVVVNDTVIVVDVQEAAAKHEKIAAIVVYASEVTATPFRVKPTLLHLASTSAPRSQLEDATANVQTAVYPVDSPYFVLPHATTYHAALQGKAHSRSCKFLKETVGGPYFDIEAVWEEHTYFEFELRSVAKTMGTMVAEPYVNHVPTMTGGIGRKALTAFYRDHFIFSNPPDTVLKDISRTVGSDRVVDEFIFCCTFTKHIDWLLPGVPPTGKRLEVPMMGVINIRGDRLYHEHIWWDNATVLKQAGVLPDMVPFDPATASLLPVAGSESATLLADETSVPVNQMLGPEYGVH